jgi:hypothetical protein
MPARWQNAIDSRSGQTHEMGVARILVDAQAVRSGTDDDVPVTQVEAEEIGVGRFVDRNPIASRAFGWSFADARSRRGGRESVTPVPDRAERDAGRAGDLTVVPTCFEQALHCLDFLARMQGKSPPAV